VIRMALSTICGLVFRVVIVAAVSLLSSCKDLGEDATTANIAVRAVTLRNSDTYQYPTLSGDEEGATIVKQAQHFKISEVRRNTSTNWDAVYVYQPEPGYTGNDYVELEITRNPVGTLGHEQTSRLGISFTIVS